MSFSEKSLVTRCGGCWFCTAPGPVNSSKGHTVVMCVLMPRGGRLSVLEYSEYPLLGSRGWAMLRGWELVGNQHI